MERKIKTAEEILKSKGITPDSKHHNYDIFSKKPVEDEMPIWCLKFVKEIKNNCGNCYSCSTNGTDGTCLRYNWHISNVKNCWCDKHQPIKNNDTPPAKSEDSTDIPH